MLKTFKIKGFKSLEDVSVELPKLAVLFGPNATGKSNFIDALQLLSRLSSERTIADALSGPIRGYPMEQFNLPDGGLSELLNKSDVSLSLEADIIPHKTDPIRYRIGLRLEPPKGIVTVADEYLVRLSKERMTPKQRPRIELVGDHLLVRRLGEAGQPRQEPLGPLELNHTLLSDTRHSGPVYLDFDRARQELRSWRIYYLDPRVAMRQPASPKEVQDIGPLGQNLAPFLYRLQWEKESFRAVIRALTSAIPNIEDVSVDLDQKRGELDIQVTQERTPYSIRVVSEGTLRVLGLCAIALNPWSGSLIAFEEPENGVHPRRLEVIVNLLSYIALEKNRQVIVTTHSPLFVSKILRLQKKYPKDVALFVCRGEGRESVIEPFASYGGLYEENEIKAALESPNEEALLQEMMVRGWLG
jgi:predicted ATPase